jgi:hypothetical protein
VARIAAALCITPEQMMVTVNSREFTRSAPRGFTEPEVQFYHYWKVIPRGPQPQAAEREALAALRRFPLLLQLLSDPASVERLHDLATTMVAVQSSAQSKAVGGAPFADVRVQVDADGLLLTVEDDDGRCVNPTLLFAYALSRLAGTPPSEVCSPLSDDGQQFQRLVGDGWRIIVVVDGIGRIVRSLYQDASSVVDMTDFPDSVTALAHS